MFQQNYRTLLRVSVLCATGVALAGGFSASAQQSALPVTAPVIVVNPQPLPVTVTNQGQPVSINGTVPVKNVDEPGRWPYEYAIEFGSSGCSLNCSNFGTLGHTILFDGPEVPEGKRLIIRHVSGRLPNTGSADVSVLLQERQILSQQTVKWAFYGPFFPQSDLPGFTSEAFATYGPGERPHINVRAPALNNFLAYVSISGYLIDATN